MFNGQGQGEMVATIFGPQLYSALPVYSATAA